MANVIHNIPVKNLILDKSLQTRPVHQEHIERLTNSEVAEWPSLKVVRQTNGNEIDTGKYYIISGQHRYHAAKIMDLATLPCEVLESYAGDDELKMIGFEENLKHGLPLTSGERKGYARLLNAAYPNLSDREIGRRAHLDGHTVAAAIHEEKSHVSKAKIPITYQNPSPALKQLQSSKSQQQTQASQGFTGGQAKTVTLFIDSLLDSDLYDLSEGMNSSTFAEIAYRYILSAYEHEDYAAVAATLRMVGNGLVETATHIR